MKSFEASSVIAATPDSIWAVLVDGAHYPDWDSGVLKVDGRVAPGETIRVVSSANPGRTFPVKVTEFSPNRSMTWSGGLPLALFKGVRTFSLTPAGDGTTRFQLREEYSGPLLSLMWRSMPDLGPSFAQFADGLKRRAEQPS
ncbi:MAG: SRPBCC domain-containing protein [Chloroflexota bacterium]|nr:SRPBCC domain-containing protein [Chloroflexota bacterium]